MSNEKQRVSLDEVSAGKWLLCILLSIVFMFVVGTVCLSIITIGVTLACGDLTGEAATFFKMFQMLSVFAFGYIGFVIFARVICKTTVKEAIVGQNVAYSKKDLAILAILYFLTFWFVTAMDNNFFASTVLNSAGFGWIVANIAMCFALVWMQTTLEELWCRMVPLRIACGNKIRLTGKCVIACLIGSLVFGLLHFANTPVASQTDIVGVLVALSCYFLFGVFFCFVDIVHETGLPGVILHWMNNLMLFAFFGAAGGLTLFVDPSGSETANPVTQLILMLPCVIYLVYVIVRRKKHQQG